jgi:chromosome partitioning protein
MKTISIINMKGGVGKSTIAVNTAFSLALKAKTLLVDLDPQFNATQYALGASRTEKYFKEKARSVVEIFERPYIEENENPIREVSHNLDILPSTLELNKVLKNPAQKEHRLSKFLKRKSNDYDYVVIDCPPTDSMLTIAAYLSSDHLLIPVRPEFLSVIGLPLLLRSYLDFTKEYPESSLRIAGIVVNWPNDRVKDNRVGQRDIEGFAKENNVNLFKTSIKYSSLYPDGARRGKPIFRTPHTRHDTKMNFSNFMQELMEVINHE